MTTDTRRRVKLYALNADRQWDDRGTGHVTSSYVDRVKGVSLLVHAENDGSMLLESKIHPDTIYHKQQDTLIVWSEGDNFDLALSFQEKAGCDEIWEKICQVQGKDPSVEITQDVVEESEDERFEDMSDSAPPIELPPCELSRLEDISEVIASGLTTANRKEKLAAAIESENYIKKLLGLFHICEDLDNQEGLHYLYEIFKNIFMLNKNGLFEIMFAEDTIFDVVGCLEYDPSGNPPKNHRQYLKKLVKFREAIPIRNTDLLAKIHQTYRVQYIQDIVLPTPSMFEDNMLNTLSSFIFFNKVEIVTLIQEDEKFLDDLFTLLTDPQTPQSKRRDSILFLKEFCNFAQFLQPQGKETFYKTLISLGVLPALEITLAINDKKTKAASIDILITIVEYSPSIVRDYTLQQHNNSDTDEDQTLINIAIEQMLSDSEPELGGAVQLMGVLRILLDPENMLSSSNKSEKSDFLTFFYKHSIQTLIAPLLQQTQTEKPIKEDYHVVQLLGLVLELLSFCVEHHTYQIKNCIINKDLLRRILMLMNSRHTFLVLGALRFLRKIISLKDEFYYRHIVKGNLFEPIVDAFIRNNGRYNLLESAILELFEFIKLEDIKSLCTYFVETFGTNFEDVDYVQTFKTLRSKYEQQQDRLKEKERGNLDSVPSILRNSNRYRRDQRQMDADEEMWFNEEEDYSEGAGKIFEKKAMDTASSLNGPKYGSVGVATPSHPLLHTAVTATATSADEAAAVGMLTMDHDADGDSGAASSTVTTSSAVGGGQHVAVAGGGAELQSTSALDPSLSHAVAVVAAAVAGHNGLQTSSAATVAAENGGSSLDVNHHHHHHHHLKQHHHHVLGAGGGAASLTPAEESALEDANSLVVSALGESDLSSVYQLQSSSSPSSIPAASSTLSTGTDKLPATVEAASSSNNGSGCEDAAAAAAALSTTSIPATSGDAAACPNGPAVVVAATAEQSTIQASTSSSSSSAVCSSSSSNSNSSGSGSSSNSSSSSSEDEGNSCGSSSDPSSGVVASAGKTPIVADESPLGGEAVRLLAAGDHTPTLTHATVEPSELLATVEARANTDISSAAAAGTSAGNEKGAMHQLLDGVAQSDGGKIGGQQQPSSDGATKVHNNCTESNGTEVNSNTGPLLVAPILDSAPAVEEPAATADNAVADVTSPTSATVPPAAVVSGLKKGLVDYEGDSDDEDDDDDDDDTDDSPAHKKARLA